MLSVANINKKNSHNVIVGGKIFYNFEIQKFEYFITLFLKKYPK